jgi:hypothetical protein
MSRKNETKREIEEKLDQTVRVQNSHTSVTALSLHFKNDRIASLFCFALVIASLQLILSHRVMVEASVRV